MAEERFQRRLAAILATPNRQLLAEAVGAILSAAAIPIAVLRHRRMNYNPNLTGPPD